LKYFNLKTLAPPSDDPPINFGVWISIKSLLSRYYLNNLQTPDDNLNIACLAGVLRSIILLSNLFFIETVA
jgi:hypothetical protein